MDRPHFAYSFLLMGVWFFYFLAVRNNTIIINICVQVLCGCRFLILNRIHFGVEGLGQMETLCFTFWETAWVFPKTASPPYVPTSNVWRLQPFHILASTQYCPSFDCGHPLGVTCVSLKCDLLSLLTNGVERLCQQPLASLLWRNVHLDPFQYEEI